MRFARAFGSFGDAPGQFSSRMHGVAVARGRLVVSEERRLHVLTLKGVPLQVLAFGMSLRRLCADEQSVWVVDAAASRVHTLALA